MCAPFNGRIPKLLRACPEPAPCVSGSSTGAAAEFALHDRHRAKPHHIFDEGILFRAAYPELSLKPAAKRGALCRATLYPRARPLRSPCPSPAAEKNCVPSTQTILFFRLRSVSAPRISNMPHAAFLPICCAALLPGATEPALRSLPGLLVRDSGHARFSFCMPRQAASIAVPRSSRNPRFGGDHLAILWQQFERFALRVHIMGRFSTALESNSSALHSKSRKAHPCFPHLSPLMAALHVI